MAGVRWPATPTLQPDPVSLADDLDAVLPQTQCTRCGYPDCRAYAEAMAAGTADINRCPPGGAEGIARLAALTGRIAIPLDAQCGIEGPRHVAVIDEAWCIGCTLCIKACPVDCIIGASKQMHVVIEADCTGCELCLPACPVDCMSLEVVTPGRSGWQAWSSAQADAARRQYEERETRRQRAERERLLRNEAKAEQKLAHLAELTQHNDDAALARKRATIEAALARARAQRGP